MLPSGETLAREGDRDHLQAARPRPIRRCRWRCSSTDDIDISRGDMICRPRNHPTVSRDIDAIVCWMAEDAQSRARPLPGQAHRAHDRAGSISELVHRIDVDTLHHDESADDARAQRDRPRPAAHRRAAGVRPLRPQPPTGAFILIDEATNETVAAGMIHGVADDARRDRRGGASAAHQRRLAAGPDRAASSAGRRSGRVGATRLDHRSAGGRQERRSATRSRSG